MSNMQQQQKQESYNREEEYVSAQRASVEAVLVGRETLQQAESQGEQLDRADCLADDTQYKLDKAGRVLRGMTWSGWVANMFTSDTGAPPESTTNLRKHRGGPPDVYENIPESCQSVAQALQNYHVNVKVLEVCESEQQKETCRLICDNMYTAANDQVEALKTNKDLEAYVLQFASDLTILRERQIASQSRVRDLGQQPKTPQESAIKKKELMEGSKQQAHSPTKPKDPITLQQDEHLHHISQSLGELGSIAQNLHQSISRQNGTIDSLDGKSDAILEKSQMVTRRADRIIQKKSWSPVKPVFACFVAIRHVRTGKYLSVVNGDVYLVPKCHPETCVYGMWKRQGEIFGLRNRFASKWVGQNLFGSLACTAANFGRREEWEAGSDWSSTKLLCASAGWGAGGYLVVRPKDHAVLIGGCGTEERKKADLWCIVEQTEEEED